METNHQSGYTTDLLERSQIEDVVWNEFIARSPQAAPYCCTWYLDVVWSGWKAIVVMEKGKMLAVMPLKVSRKYGISYVFNPPFCQYVGIFFGEIEKRNTVLTLTVKKRLVKAIVEAVPKEVKVFNMKFAPEFDYPMPFHWAGYVLHARYSYWLDNQADKLAIFRNLSESARNYIHKAGRNGLVVQPVENIDGIIGLAKDQNAYPFDSALLKRLWGALCKQGVGTALEVLDNKGSLCAGIIYIQYHHKIIHLFGAYHPSLGRLGAMSLAMWKSIEMAGPAIKVIDFEGSMLESIENFFRSFGSRPLSYLQIQKNTLPKPVRWLLG